MIEITIKLEETGNTARVVRSYASVGRAFDCIEEALNKLLPVGVTDDDDVNMAFDAIETLRGPLSEVQMLLREAMGDRVQRLWTYDGLPNPK